MKPLLILCFVMSCILGHAQVTIDNLMSPAFPSGMTSSPDGKRIAWIFNDSGVRNVYVAESPEFAAKKLTPYTTEDGLDLSALAFASNEQLIFIKGAATNKSGEAANPLSLQENVEQSIWSLKWTGELRRIGKGYGPAFSPDGNKIAYLSGGQVYLGLADAGTEGKRLFQIRGSQGSLQWSPDGTQIAFTSSRGDHTFVGVFDTKTLAINFLDPSFDNDTNPVWSPDGTQLAYTRTPTVKNALPFFSKRDGYPWAIRTVNVASGEVKQIWKAPDGKGSILTNDLPAIENKLFWIDNKIIFPWERTGWIHLYSINSTGGEAKELTPGIGEVEHASFSRDKKSLLIVTNIGDIDRRHIWKVTAEGKAQQLSIGKGIEWSVAETINGLACLKSDATTTAWPHLIDKGGKQKMLAQELFPKIFPKSLLVVPQAVEITAKDGMKVPGQIFLPKNMKDGEKHPAVIFFHGGSRRQMLLGYNYGQYYHNAYSMNQYMASLGYIVLSLNYRSGIGYGLDFREALLYGAEGASEYNDVVGAGKFLRDRADVDAKRIGLWGGSYGGYLTAMGLARNSDMFSAGVDIHGVHDWNPVIKNFVPSYDPLKLAEVSKKAFESSPLNFIDGWKSPVLLVHGDDDRNVPFNETVTLVEALRQQHVYFEQLIFPDEVHFFLLHQSWVKTYKRAADFFEQEFKKVK
ncbi:MAG: prolyl oligopeptidase family serine peptidase [Chryseolinea sp.]